MDASLRHGIKEVGLDTPSLVGYFWAIKRLGITAASRRFN
jgi:hypothetical protein